VTPGYPFGSDTPSISAFTDVLQELVDRYKTTVSAYEICNEPNYVPFSNPINPAAYAQLLAAACPIIKDPVNGDPTATVVAGAAGATQDGPSTMNPVSFVQQMLAAGAGEHLFSAVRRRCRSGDLESASLLQRSRGNHRRGAARSEGSLR
jgi:hypothetical protein